MKVLVCGGRRYANAAKLAEVMDGYTITEIIQGGATGADNLAKLYADKKAITCREFVADWRKHGRAAGPIRNKQMLDEGKPDLVVAFPGGHGTADMVRQAKRAGVPVMEVKA